MHIFFNSVQWVSYERRMIFFMSPYACYWIYFIRIKIYLLSFTYILFLFRSTSLSHQIFILFLLHMVVYFIIFISETYRLIFFLPYISFRFGFGTIIKIEVNILSSDIYFNFSSVNSWKHKLIYFHYHSFHLNSVRSLE
jgi:hypothetical protein